MISKKNNPKYKTNSEVVFSREIKKPFYKKIYHITIKPLINILTLKLVRNLISKNIRCLHNKKIVKEMEKHFLPNTVIIFQHQFFDTLGKTCFNGGAERYIQDLSEILHDEGYNPILIQRGSKKIWDNNINNLHIIGLPCKSNSDYIEMIKYFTKYKFVVYSGATQWGKTLLHPNVLISHGITWDVPNNDIKPKTILNIFNDVDNFVSVDTNSISWLRTTFAKTMSTKKMIYIPNYVDTKIYTNMKKNTDRFKIIFPRRASPERGYWLISAALPPILSKYPNVDFDFIGFAHGDKITNDIKKIVNDFPNRVRHYVVNPDEMPKFYQSADIALIPTLYAEGTSLSCLEAQACGNIVVATNIGGLPNLIIDGYNGVLINPDAQELMVELDKILFNENLRKQLSANAVSVAKAFDKSIWIKKWTNVVNFVGK